MYWTVISQSRIAMLVVELNVGYRSLKLARLKAYWSLSAFISWFSLLNCGSILVVWFVGHAGAVFHSLVTWSLYIAVTL
jgi:hypothetical protein